MPLRGEFDQAVKRGPAGHLRIGVVTPLAAHFPDAVVRFTPLSANRSAKADEQPPLLAVEPSTPHHIARSRHNNRTVHVQLSWPQASLPIRTGREPR